MGASSDSSGKLGDTDMIALTGKIMIVTLILLSFVLVFAFCLHLYAKWFRHRHEQNTTTTTTIRRRRRLDFAAGHQEIILIPCSRIGLDPCVLKSIPVVIYDPNEFKDGLECAVCLCEVSQGEKARILPKCNHGFHVECIDMWFQSHSTCPLCRNPVANEKQSDSAGESTMEDIVHAPMGVYSTETEAPSFPTNVLFWGDETQVSAFGPCIEEDHLGSPIAESSSMALTSNRPDGMLVIDIQRTIDEEEDQKSPEATIVGSMKRLLSGNRKTNPPNPRNLDLENGRQS